MNYSGVLFVQTETCSSTLCRSMSLIIEALVSRPLRACPSQECRVMAACYNRFHIHTPGAWVIWELTWIGSSSWGCLLAWFWQMKYWKCFVVLVSRKLLLQALVKDLVPWWLQCLSTWAFLAMDDNDGIYGPYCHQSCRTVLLVGVGIANLPEQNDLPAVGEGGKGGLTWEGCMLYGYQLIVTWAGCQSKWVK